MGLEQELAEFSGSETLYEHFTGFRYTDGVKYLADRLRCEWLIDLVASYQHEVSNVPFQLWRIQVDERQSALVTMAEDVDRPALVSQRVLYTDFGLPDFSFYCVAAAGARVMMLKTEY